MSSDATAPQTERAARWLGVRGLLFIVSAPSGTGKTTLVDKLVQVLPNLRMIWRAWRSWGLCRLRPLHYLREHDLMGRFRNGHGRGDALHTGSLNPREQV